MTTRKTKVIDGMTFSIEPVPGLEQLPLLHMVTDVLSGLLPVLSKLIGKKKSVKELKLEDIDVGEMLIELPGFLAKSRPDKLRELQAKLLEQCMVKLPTKGGKSEEVRLLDVFDTKMQGKIGTILKLLVWALEVNYGDFFSGARAAAQEMKTGESGSVIPTKLGSTQSAPTQSEEG